MTRICVIGAGPVGTTMALALIRAGFDTTLIEREAAPPDDPRAATLQPPTLAMLAALGSGTEVIERGLKARHFQFRDRATDEILAEFDYGLLADLTDHPFAVQCEQVKVANANLAAIRADGSATLRLGTEMRGMEQDADGVTVRFAAGSGDELSERFDYVIGCDGGRSPTRKAAGIAFEGFTYEERFLVLTTRRDFFERGFCVRNYVLDPVQWCALFKVPHDGPPGLWRTVFPARVAEGEDPAICLGDDYVQAQISGLDADLDLTDVLHRNLYAVNQRVAAAFRKGRLCLAGDAAHVNNPLGGLGMNSGIHDAMNLAGKLTAARTDPSRAEALLDAYDRERRTMAVDYVQAQTMQNKKRLEARTPEARAAAMADLRASAEDPARHRAWVLQASLIKGLQTLEHTTSETSQ